MLDITTSKLFPPFDQNVAAAPSPRKVYCLENLTLKDYRRLQIQPDLQKIWVL